MGKPSLAYSIVEPRMSVKGSLPNFLCNSSQPETQPGTDHDNGPYKGISFSLCALKYSRVALYGERPLALRPYSFLVLLSQTMANRSPPMPHDIGSMSPRAASAAMAASTAVPPLRKTSSPICVASAWLVATMPFLAMTTDLPV